MRTKDFLQEYPVVLTSFSVDTVGENMAIVSWKGYQDSYRMLLSNRELTEQEKPRYHYLLDTIVDHSEGLVINDLEPASNYYVYAQGFCDNGDSTAISMTYATFRTSCPTEGGAGLPFFDESLAFVAPITSIHVGTWASRPRQWSMVNYRDAHVPGFTKTMPCQNGLHQIEYPTSEKF